MNVEAAWNQGFTGKGVVIGILSDGLEWTHSQIADHYDSEASIDLIDNGTDPSPRQDLWNSNDHGTSLAGIIVSTPDDFYCGVGIANNAKVGGIRMLDGETSDMLEQSALSFNPQHIDIYNAAWGPQDNGKTIDGPGEGALKALNAGIKTGRNGKGSIYVWASGQGGFESDNCNCDGFVSSIYTIAVGSVKSNGEIPRYAEQCSPCLAVTFSSTGTQKEYVVTAGLMGKCKVSQILVQR